VTEKAIRPNKLSLWFRAFIDETNPATFMNQTGAAKAAGYRCTTDESFRAIGYQNFTKLHNRIELWLDEMGLSDTRLMLKLIELLEAKETKYFQKDGVVTDQRDVEALEVQRRTLDMIFRMKGMYAPERHEHNGKGGGPIKAVAEMTDPELLEIAALHDSAGSNGA
jgi:hypothetical protein